MKVIPLLDQPISQAEFAQLIGVSEARVSQLVSEGVIARGDTALAWLLGYCERLRDQAAGRSGAEAGGLDLVQERAALAREQRIGQAIKNRVARQEFAPVGLLSDVLARASSALVDQLDQFEGLLRKSAPDVPDEAKVVVLQMLAKARNAWIKGTADLVVSVVDAMQAEDADESANDPAVELEGEGM